VLREIAEQPRAYLADHPLGIDPDASLRLLRRQGRAEQESDRSGANDASEHSH
jgi:hypothetical protein